MILGRPNHRVLSYPPKKTNKKQDVVVTGRKMLGATNPLASEPGTIRGDFSIDVGRNICHGSDSVESANREIALWCVALIVEVSGRLVAAGGWVSVGWFAGACKGRPSSDHHNTSDPPFQRPTTR